MPEQGKKGKTRQNDSKHLMRMASRNRAAKRHVSNAAIQDAAARQNQGIRARGEFTPWEIACNERAARRMVTCAHCRIPFGENGECEECRRTGRPVNVNFRTAWEKRGRREQLPAA